MKSVIRVRTSAGVYDLDMRMVAMAMASSMYDVYDVRGHRLCVADGMDNPSRLVNWLMSESSFAEWITYGRKVSDDIVGGNFWVDDSNFEILGGGSIEASISRLNNLGALIEDSWRYKHILN